MSDDKIQEEKEKSQVACPECGSTEIISDSTRGERICTNCGAVIDEHIIDEGPEWRAFTSEERNKHDKGLATQIGWEDRDVYGKKLSPRRRAQIYRLRKWQIRTRVHSSMDRNLAYAMSELDRLSSQIGIPRTVKETAAVIYRKAIERHLIRGRSIEAMIAAAVYAAARIRRVPRTLDEIAKNRRISKKELGRCYRLIVRELQIRIPLANPIDYIIRFSAELRLSGHTAQRAIEIIDQAKENGLTAGKDPTGLAAASIYIAGIIEGERRTQREIAETATVTEVTVRNRYKELVRRLGIEITV
ncbi:MAG: transcription initiation factor IIB [Candidatus Heimdallarchaeota archaeon]